MIKCFKCGTEHSDNAKFCNNCGERVDGKTVCPKCNKEIAANSNFCEFCGYVVKKTDVISDYVVRRRKKLSGEGKTLIHNITTLALSVMFFVFSLLPVFKINISSFFSQNQDLDIYYNISIFQMAGAIPQMYSDKTNEESISELTEILQDEISTATLAKISQREELSSREIKEINDAFNSCNFLALSLSRENIEKGFASFILFLFLMIAVFAAAVMPLIFCVYGVLGIIKKKIYKMSIYSFVILLPLCVCLFFLLGKSNAYRHVSAFSLPQFIDCFLGTVFTFTYAMVTSKRKLDVKGFVKRTVSVALIVLTILTLSANVVTFRYNYEGSKTYNDGENFENFIHFTDNLLSEDVKYVTAEETNAAVENLASLNKSQRNFYFGMINSLNNIFSEDMNENYNSVLIISSFISLLYIGSFAMLLTVFILYLLQIFNNVYKNKFRYALFKIIGLGLLLINIILLIVLAVTYNESTAAIEVNTYISLTAWPFICLVIFSALLMCTLLNGKEKGSKIREIEHNLYKEHIQTQLQSENAEKSQQKAPDSIGASGDTVQEQKKP